MNSATTSRGGTGGFLAGIVGLVITGAFVVWQLAAQGHAAFNTTSLGLMWGLPIVTYDFLLMSSAGLGIVAALGTVFGLPAFRPLARRAVWLALALLVGAGAALFFELGSPLRALWAIPLNFQVASPLFWKVIGVVVYAICLILLASGWVAKGADAKPSSGVSVVALVAAVFVIFTGSLLFATLSMRPFWFSGEVPVMFLVESVLAGLAFALLFTHLAGTPDEATRAAVSGPLPRLVALLIAIQLAFVLGRMVVGLAANLDGMQVWQTIVASPAFWIQIAFLAVALWLTSSPGMRASGSMQVAALLLLLIALFLGKYEFVIGGQLVPLFKGSWAHGLIQYSPSTTEWALLAMAGFLAYAVYAFGAARFRLGGAA
ncbi:MAG: polysulfide reductase NrfD [Burkholderiales bacterium]|nr:polysulfide reductase NrfD [Burkholderiales bacterium]